jgi:hypothetical protein
MEAIVRISDAVTIDHHLSDTSLTIDIENKLEVLGVLEEPVMSWEDLHRFTIRNPRDPSRTEDPRVLSFEDGLMTPTERKAAMTKRRRRLIPQISTTTTVLKRFCCPSAHQRRPLKTRIRKSLLAVPLSVLTIHP